jgi:hypothetical protein
MHGGCTKSVGVKCMSIDLMGGRPTPLWQVGHHPFLVGPLYHVLEGYVSPFVTCQVSGVGCGTMDPCEVDLRSKL